MSVKQTVDHNITLMVLEQINKLYQNQLTPMQGQIKELFDSRNESRIAVEKVNGKIEKAEIVMGFIASDIKAIKKGQLWTHVFLLSAIFVPVALYVIQILIKQWASGTP